MVAEFALVVSSPADSVTPPEDELASLMCSLVGSTSVVGDRSIISSNVIVNIPVTVNTSAEENVGFTESAVSEMVWSVAALIVLPTVSLTASASMSSCGVVNAMTV